MTHRGITNKNHRGNTKDRERRRKFLLKTYESNKSPGTCRCYRCGKVLNRHQLTIDRIVPGAKGGKYVRHNIRPACAPCNMKTGATVRR